MSTKRVRAAPQLKHRIERFAHTSSTSLLRGLGSQPAPSMSVTRHAAAYAADTCHSEVVLSHLCELGQSLQSHSQKHCLRIVIHVNRKFTQEEVKFFYQAFTIDQILCKHNLPQPVTRQMHKHFVLWPVAYSNVGKSISSLGGFAKCFPTDLLTKKRELPFNTSQYPCHFFSHDEHFIYILHTYI